MVWTPCRSFYHRRHHCHTGAATCLPCLCIHRPAQPSCPLHCPTPPCEPVRMPLVTRKVSWVGTAGGMISLAWQNNPGGEWALLKQSLNNGASNKAIRSGGGTGTRAAREKNGAPINKAQIEKKLRQGFTAWRQQPPAWRGGDRGPAGGCPFHCSLHLPAVAATAAQRCEADLPALAAQPSSEACRAAGAGSRRRQGSHPAGRKLTCRAWTSRPRSRREPRPRWEARCCCRWPLQAWKWRRHGGGRHARSGQRWRQQQRGGADRRQKQQLIAAVVAASTACTHTLPSHPILSQGAPTRRGAGRGGPVAGHRALQVALRPGHRHSRNRHGGHGGAGNQALVACWGRHAAAGAGSGVRGAARRVAQRQPAPAVVGTAGPMAATTCTAEQTRSPTPAHRQARAAHPEARRRPRRRGQSCCQRRWAAAQPWAPRAPAPARGPRPSRLARGRAPGRGPRWAWEPRRSLQHHGAPRVKARQGKACWCNGRELAANGSGWWLLHASTPCRSQASPPAARKPPQQPAASHNHAEARRTRDGRGGGGHRLGRVDGHLLNRPAEVERR